MKALIIYESMFGNTQTIAESIAGGMSAIMETELVEVGMAPTSVSDDVSILVIGAPTHQFGISRPSSREQARRSATHALVSNGIGVREWLDGPRRLPDQIQVATFGTVLTKPRFLRYFGTAGRSIEKRLARRGHRVIVPPESFWVEGSTGPLRSGDVERAREWGARLAQKVSAEAGQRAEMTHAH